MVCRNARGAVQESWLHWIPPLRGAYQRNRARRYGLLDELEMPDEKNVELMKAANQKISEQMNAMFR